MRHLDLFSGIGGFALAAQWVWGKDHEIISFCEIEPFCQKVLKKHWPNIPICKDIKHINSYIETMKEEEQRNESYAERCEECSANNCPRDCGHKRRRKFKIDLITAGYPCQPFSTASHGRIIAQDLSPWALRTVRNELPKYCIFENVQRSTIENTEGQLQDFGYNTNVMRMSADDVGADHKRSRWWLIAHTNNKSKLQQFIDAEMAIMQKVSHNIRRKENPADILGAFNGISNRMDRLKSLGNAIVPRVAEVIMRAIKSIDEMEIVL